MDHLAISVCDQERSRAFYEAHFGFGARPARRYDDGVLMLYDRRGFALALAPSPEPVAHRPFAHFGRSLPTRQAVLDLRERLVKDGVELVQANDEPDYVSVKCRDPDGYVVEGFWEPGSTALDHLAQPPSLAIDGRRWLRSLEDQDAEELYALVADNRAHLAAWMPWAARQTLQATREFIATSRQQSADRQAFQMAILEDGAIAGTIGFHRIDWENRATSIGYWIARSAQGRGTATLAVRALVDHAFASWGLHRIEIRAATANRRSRAIPERLGFRQEGTLREVERIGQRYHDLVVYAVLAPDWGQAER